MKLLEAITIFENIESNHYSTEDKISAISEICKMQKHLKVKKEQLLAVIWYLLSLMGIDLRNGEE